MSLIKCWCTVKELGHFGGDYTAIFRGNQKVTVKKLRRADYEEESEKVLEESFNIKDIKRLNHPNLIQMLGFTTELREAFMIVEFMAEGDLKNYLQKLKRDPQRMKAETRVWSKIFSWNIEVARGMERLESLNIVHRELAAR